MVMVTMYQLYSCFKTYLNNNLKQLVTLLLIVVSLFLANPTYAIDCGTSPALTATSDPPLMSQIVCPFLRVFNFVILAAGVAFTVMIVYGGIKISTAVGDPKAMEQGKQTWVYAVVGVAVVLGFFTIFFIILGLVGVGGGCFSSPMAPFDCAQNSINEFLRGTNVVKFVP